MSNSAASFLALSLGSPSSTYESRRDRNDDKDRSLSDFFQIFGQGLMQSALEQICAVDKKPAPGQAHEDTEDIAQNYIRQSTLQMMTTMSGGADAGWPGNLRRSNDNIFSGLSGFADFTKFGDFPGLADFPGLGAFPKLSAYQNAGLASQLGGNYLIEEALRTVARGLGKPLDEVRATHLREFTAVL